MRFNFRNFRQIKAEKIIFKTTSTKKCERKVFRLKVKYTLCHMENRLQKNVENQRICGKI